MTRSNAFFLLIMFLFAGFSFSAENAPDVDERRLEIYEAWHNLPVPPITPYSGPFGAEARAFIGNPREMAGTHPEIFKAFMDFPRLGTYDPAKDPRPINLEFEKAILDDWRRMGYNTAYKGNYNTYRVGRWLKQQGMLGAIDQTIWGTRSDPPLGYDGKRGPSPVEGCGSFFAASNYNAGVTAVSRMAINHEIDLVKVGDYSITCSWDEVGMRTRSMIDYRPQAITEYRKYLEEVWFQDDSPDKDTNKDGRTFNQFTKENHKTWNTIQPPMLSRRFYSSPAPDDQKWDRLGAFKLWLDFHRYYTFEFFRRINNDASKRAGKKIECYPFPQAFMMWPGANVHWGMSVYWNARINPIINIEQCWSDSPAMALNYAQSDRLVRKFKNVLMGWSWFYFADEAGDMYDGPGDIERALARMMGHRVDGIHHWLYSPQYRSRHKNQRLQLAYWHNFLGKHYASFLSRSAPPEPDVALLVPDYTGYFYRMFNYAKGDYAYTAAALLEAQLPFEIVAEEEIELEPDTLEPYKVLYVVGSEWTTPTIRKRISQFIADGGVVFANGDSLSLDIPTGKRTDFLAENFGIKLRRKHKNPFYPSTQNLEEEAWGAELTGWGKPLSFQGHHLHKPGTLSRLWKRAGGKVVRNEEEWKKVDEVMARMPKKGRGGIEQIAIDMRTPPKIRYDIVDASLVTYGEINTGTVTRGRAIARYGDEVCGVETEKTVWLGTRPGLSLHAIAPRLSLSRPTEPANPYPVEVSDNYSTHKPYVDVIAYAARKAGVKRIVTMKLRGDIPCNLEVLPRVDKDGNIMVIVINHDGTNATYRVTIDSDYVKNKLPAKSTAWNLLKTKLIEKETDGQFNLAVPARRVAVFFVGSEEVLEPVRQAQAKLDAMDMSVPQYFRDRSKLNENQWNTPIPAE